MKSSRSFACDLPLTAVLKLPLILLLVLFVFSYAPLHAQALKKVPFPFSPIGINSLPWFVAKEAHLSEKHGIDFDPVFIGASAVLFPTRRLGAGPVCGFGSAGRVVHVLMGG